MYSWRLKLPGHCTERTRAVTLFGDPKRTRGLKLPGHHTEKTQAVTRRGDPKRTRGLKAY